MNRSQTKTLTVFFTASLTYLLSSYLLLLKDPFRLERIAIASNQPSLEAHALELASILKVNITAPTFLTISILGLFIAYFKLIQHKSTTKKIIIHPLFLGSILAFILSFPILSSDVFDYNNYNRVAFIHNQNPWTTPANAFPNDGRIYLGNWIDRPSVYPPISHLTFAAVHFIFGQNLIFNLLGFKLLNLFIFLSVIHLLEKQQLNKSKLLLFNPLILIEFISNAHNDLLVGALLLAAVLAHNSGRTIISGLSWSFSVLAKISTIFIAPLFLAKHILAKNWTKLTLFITSILLVIVSTYIFTKTFFNSFLLNINLQSTFMLRSLPFFIRHTLITYFPTMRFEETQTIQKLISFSLFGTSLLFILSKSKKLSLATLSVLVFMTYLIFASPMLQPWYLGWFIPLLPLIPSRLRNTVLILNLTSSFHYSIEQFSLFLDPLNPLWHISTYLFIILPPTVYLLFPKTWYTRVTKQL